MNKHRFTLEKYDRIKRNRYTCPVCAQKKEFTHYIDILGRFQFPANVGKCNRINNCGYHYTPSMFFRDNPEVLKELMNEENTSSTHHFSKTIFSPITSVNILQPNKPSYIEEKIMDVSCNTRWYTQNNLFNFLSSKLGIEEITQLFQEYHIGTSKKWNGGATVFWQVSMNEKIHAGKIMLYNQTNGHRVKEGYSRISWVHSELNIENFRLEQCFFGEHLLKQYPDKTVAIVESEKSALIAAAYMKNFIWLASGGINGCLNMRYPILRGRKICLFPDSKAYDFWYTFYIKLKSENFMITISDILENNTSKEQWDSGIDIADILLEQSPQEAILQFFLHTNPVLQDLIDTFRLELIKT
jgi:hypothetical protein